MINQQRKNIYARSLYVMYVYFQKILPHKMNETKKLGYDERIKIKFKYSNK
ncbi:hypothetical protein NIES22_23500 [Calothrix brevissima NIES-22]|nr:hypothetical protein NIES22_23500 [Calothrix brevissima NIES-22]